MSEQLFEQKTAPAVEELPQGRVIFVICRNRDLPRLKREFEQWEHAGYCLLTSGTTIKRFDYIPIKLIATPTP